jgi:hypothetical protein
MLMNSSRASAVIPASRSSVALAVGALVVGLLGGWLVRSSPPSGGRSLPQVQALASLAADSFAACTTLIDATAEGFFILDFQTGDLTGGVINPQANAAKFTRVFSYNVLKDVGFDAARTKEPSFLLVAGRMNFTGPGSNALAQSVLYVTDVSTGVTAAYGIPWNPQQARVPGKSELVLLDVARPRGGGVPAQ